MDCSCFVSQGDRGDPGPPGLSGPKGDGYPGPLVSKKMLLLKTIHDHDIIL